MSLVLSAADLERLAGVTRVLLSPLEAPSVAEWRGEVSRALRELFRADRAVHWLPAGVDAVHAEGVERDTLDGYREFIEGPLIAGTPSPDPLVSRFMERCRVEGMEVYSHAVVDRALDGRLRDSAFHNEVERAAGLHDMLAVRTAVRGASGPLAAAVALTYDRPGKAPFGEEGLSLLRALLPSYRAGLEVLGRLHAQRQVLDVLPEPLAAFDAAGRELHRNAALVRLLAADGRPERLAEEIRHLARSLSAAGLLRDAGAALAKAGTREVRTDGGRYLLRGTLLPAGAFGGDPGVLVVVESGGGPALPAAEELRGRYRLTRKEAEVALLLAEGLSNAEVAGRLFVSASTARRHTENVLAKVGLRSRKALALVLLRGGDGGG
jgi:DNA-binding CsgD family transcriptional regulator